MNLKRHYSREKSFQELPSGNILTNKVEVSKKVFSPKVNNQNKRKREGDSQTAPLKEPKVANANGAELHSSVTNRLKDKANRLRNRTGSLDRWVNKHGDNQHDQRDGHLSQGRLRKSISVNYIPVDQIEDPSFEVLQRISDTMKSKAEDPAIKEVDGASAQSECETETDQEMEINDIHNPAVMSVSTVQEMFAALKLELQRLNTKVEKIEANQEANTSEATISDCVSQVVSQVNNQLENGEIEKVEELKTDLKYFKRKTRTLTDVVERMSVEIEDLKSRLENVEISTSKRAISISGLYLDGQKSEMIERVEHFLYNRIGVSTSVDDVYKMGSKEPKLVIAYLQSGFDKRRIMRNKYRLKDLRNKDGGRIYINDYTTAIQQEKRKREKKIKEDNSALDKPLEIKFYKGQMMIQGETYKPKVAVPTPKQLIEIEPKELDNILKLQLNASEKLIKEKSIFEGYAASVSSYQEINRLYVKMKLIQPMARHIVCAYYLPGEEQKHYTQGFCDDDEHGAGKQLLNLLVENKIVNRVVFVSRKYGGIRMGAERFQCYVQATKNVLSAHTKNTVLKIEQYITEQVQKPINKKVTPTYNNNRGGGRGRGTPTPIRGGHRQSTQRQPVDECYYEPRSKQQSFNSTNEWSFSQDDWASDKDREYYAGLSSHENSNSQQDVD